MVELRVCCESGGFGLVLLIIVCVVFIHFPKVYTEKKANPGAGAERVYS